MLEKATSLGPTAEVLVEHDRRLVAGGDEAQQAVLGLVEQAGWVELGQARTGAAGLVGVARQRALEVLVGELVLVAEHDRVLARANIGSVWSGLHCEASSKMTTSKMSCRSGNIRQASSGRMIQHGKTSVSTSTSKSAAFLSSSMRSKRFAEVAIALRKRSRLAVNFGRRKPS